jgi:hypothetical protein
MVIQKRRRRDYRLARKAAFTRPEPGFSLYEGRTRGKRMRYTFSDDEEDSDNFSAKRSARNSGVSTPAEQTGPTVTASGRHVKSRLGGMYGETMLVDQRKEAENERAAANAADSDREQDNQSGRQQRSTRPRRPTRAPRRLDDSSEDVNTESDRASSGHEWSSNEEEPEEPDAEGFEADGDDEDDEMSANDWEMDDAPPEQDSLIVQLRYKRGHAPARSQEIISNADGDATAADCIAVDSGRPAVEAAKASRKDTVHLNGESSREGEVSSPFQGLPPNGINGALPQHIDSPKKAQPGVPNSPGVPL